MKKLMGIFSNKAATNARELMGFPVRMAEREVSPVEDDRIMFDGRPAYAWWNEIQTLRNREPELQRREMAMREQMVVLRIAKWAMSKEMLTYDTILRIKLHAIPLMASDPMLELLNNPEKYVEVVPAPASTDEEKP